MDDDGTLGAQVAALDEAALTELLARRPDVLRGARPRDLTDLAGRLAHPVSLAAALQTLPLPCLHVAEALQALGGRASREELSTLLDGDGPQHATDVDAALASLSDLMIVGTAPGAVQVPDGMRALFPTPLGLGPPLRALLAEETADSLRRVQRALDLPRGTTKATVVDALTEYLSDPVAVRSVLAAAPPDFAAYLTMLAGGVRGGMQSPDGNGDDADDDLYDDVYEDLHDGLDDDGAGDFLGGFAGRYDPAQAQVRLGASRWAAERGLLVGSEWSYHWQMPAEVGLALRGPHYRAPFSPRPPDVPRLAVDIAAVATECAAAATGFAQHAVAVLDHLARSPVPRLKAGGIGIRELRRLATATGTEHDAVRLILALALDVDLLQRDGPAIGVSTAFDEWRAADPAERYTALLQAWWESGNVATESQDADGKALPALGSHRYCGGCRAARVALITAAAQIPEGFAADRAPLATAALWAHPLVHVVDADPDAPFALLWREAELLGVFALGALTGLGRRLRAEDDHDLLRHVETVLPATATAAVFGADLTVLVAGTPAANVSRVLDAAADRESHGAAVMWRFSPASIRRALDAGIAAGELEHELGAVAVGELPQPLRYLIGDVARLHGNLRVWPAVSCVHGDDAAVLAQATADRKLARLGLRHIGPNLLTSTATVEATVAALRAAGYFPMPAGTADPPGDATASRPDATARAAPRRVPSEAMHREAPPPAPDPAAVASDLLRRGPAIARPSATEAEVGNFGRQLSVAEVRQLAHAIDAGTPVQIDYRSAGGTVTRRTISDLEIIGANVRAWCALRSDERYFTLARIHAVQAVEAGR